MTRSRNGVAMLPFDEEDAPSHIRRGYSFIGNKKHQFPKQPCYLGIISKTMKWNLFADKISAIAWLEMMGVKKSRIKSSIKYFLSESDAKDFVQGKCK